MLLAAIVVCGAAGFAIGALVGATAPIGLAGVLVGLVAGVAVVYFRYREV